MPKKRARLKKFRVNYDTNGNMITDSSKGVNSIIYNHLNLPTTVSSSQGTLNYTYDASGVKLKKSVNGQTTEYAGAFLYKNGSLEMIHTPEGYIEHDNGVFKYVYRITDHLGNTRVSFKDADGNGSIDTENEVVEVNSYYPFGLEQQKPNTTIGSTNLGQKFKYNGKEMVDDIGLDWYDFGARNYSPELGRWMNLDLLSDATDLISSSPYSYALNNPLAFTDPDGNCPPGVDCVGIILSVKSGYESVKETASSKIKNANRVASVMVKDYDKMSKATGGNGISVVGRATIYTSSYIREFGDLTSANDGSVLSTGKNLDGSTASGLDKGLAAGAVILPVSGKVLKELGGQGLESLTKIYNKISNQTKALDAKHIDAAVGDILGKPVTKGERIYDHETEVRNNLRGLARELKNLNKKIESGEFSGDVLKAAEELRSKLQKQKDEVNAILDRTTKKIKENQFH